jgi:hypothetical protein
MIKLKFYLGMEIPLLVNYQFHDCHQAVLSIRLKIRTKQQ